jgi:hypothetical protein
MRATCLVLASALLGLTAAAAEQFSFEYSNEIDLSEAKVIEIHNLLGSVEVVGGERGERARVDTRVVGESKDAEQAKALASGVAIEARGDTHPTVTATFPVPPSGELALPRDEEDSIVSSLLRRVFDREPIQAQHSGRTVMLGPSRRAEKLAVHFRVRVPHDSTVRIQQAAGTVLVARFRGRAEVEILGGSVRLEQTFGSIAVKSEKADVEIASFQGEALSVVSTEGAIRVNDSVPRGVQLQTVKGSVQASRVEAGNLQVETHEGDIELDAVEAQSFQVRSGSGEIRFGTRMKGLHRGAVRTASGDVSMLVGGVTPFALRTTAPEGSVATDRLPGLERVGTDGGAILYRRGRPGAEIEIATDSGEVTFRRL